MSSEPHFPASFMQNVAPTNTQPVQHSEVDPMLISFAQLETLIAHNYSFEPDDVLRIAERFRIPMPLAKGQNEQNPYKYVHVRGKGHKAQVRRNKNVIQYLKIWHNAEMASLVSNIYIYRHLSMDEANRNAIDTAIAASTSFASSAALRVASSACRHAVSAAAVEASSDVSSVHDDVNDDVLAVMDLSAEAVQAHVDHAATVDASTAALAAPHNDESRGVANALAATSAVLPARVAHAAATTAAPTAPARVVIDLTSDDEAAAVGADADAGAPWS